MAPHDQIILYGHRNAVQGGQRFALCAARVALSGCFQSLLFIHLQKRMNAAIPLTNGLQAVLHNLYRGGLPSFQLKNQLTGSLHGYSLPHSWLKALGTVICPSGPAFCIACSRVRPGSGTSSRVANGG